MIFLARCIGLKGNIPLFELVSQWQCQYIGPQGTSTQNILGDVCIFSGESDVDKYCTYINAQISLQHLLGEVPARSWDTVNTTISAAFTGLPRHEITHKASIVTAFSNDSFTAVSVLDALSSSVERVLFQETQKYIERFSATHD